MSVEIESSHGGFMIDGAVPALSTTPAIQDNTLVNWWPDTAPDLSGFFVQGGSQSGPYAITAQMGADPGEAGTDWEDVVELSVMTAGAITINEVVDGPVETLPVPPGTYRLRLSSRGRTEGYERAASFPDEDEEKDESPLEHFLVQLWPAAATPAVVLRQDSGYAHERLHPSEPVHPPEREPGLTAAWAIVRDLRGDPGARPIPGDLGDVVLDLDLPGTPTRLFNRIRHAFAWPPCTGGAGSADEPGQTAYYYATLPEYDGVYEDAGQIATTLLQVDKPRQVVKAWNWVPEVDASPSRPYPLDQRPRLLPADSTVTLTIAPSLPDGGAPRCTVRLEHYGVPAAWIADLTALWTWHLVVLSEW